MVGIAGSQQAVRNPPQVSNSAAVVIEQERQQSPVPDCLIPAEDVILLRGDSSEEVEEDKPIEKSKEKRPRKVQFGDDVVDNEFLGRKSSKVCCIYRKPPQPGEQSSDESSDSDSDDDPSRPNAYERQPKSVRRAQRHKKKHANSCEHDHENEHDHEHNNSNN